MQLILHDDVLNYNTDSMKKWNALLGLLVGAIVVRLIALNQSLWLDETTTANVVRTYSFWDIGSKFSPHDFHPPFYYLFMDCWTQLFGYSEVALRAPSVLASVVTGYVVYLITVLKLRLQKNRSVALLSASLFLFNPLVIYYSQEARMYAMSTLWTTLHLFFILKMERSSGPRLPNILRANLFGFLALTTFYGTIFFIVAHSCYLVITKKYRTLILTSIGSLFAVIILHPLFRTQLHNSGEVLAQIPNWSVTLGKANIKNLALIPIKFATGKINPDPKIIFYSIAGLWTLVIAFFSLRNIMNPKYRSIYMVWLMPLVLGFFVSFYKPLLQYFRFQYVLPFMSIALAVGASSRWQRSVLLGGFAIFALFYLLFPGNHREDWRSLVRQLPPRIVIFATPSSIDPLSYYDASLRSRVFTDTATLAHLQEVLVVPYVMDIYGIDYVRVLHAAGFKHRSTVMVRALEYQRWEK